MVCWQGLDTMMATSVLLNQLNLMLLIRLQTKQNTNVEVHERVLSVKPMTVSTCRD